MIDANVRMYCDQTLFFLNGKDYRKIKLKKSNNQAERKWFEPTWCVGDVYTYTNIDCAKNEFITDLCVYREGVRFWLFLFVAVNKFRSPFFVFVNALVLKIFILFSFVFVGPSSPFTPTE